MRKNAKILCVMLVLLMCGCQNSLYQDNSKVCESFGLPEATDTMCKETDVIVKTEGDDIHQSPPPEDDGVGLRFTSLQEFIAYANSPKNRDYTMGIANDEGLVPVPVKNDVADSEAWIYRVQELYDELFFRSWIWYYHRGEKGLIIVTVAKLTEDEKSFAQSATCSELITKIYPDFVNLGDEVDVYSSIYQQEITLSGDYQTTAMMYNYSPSHYPFEKMILFEKDGYLIKITDRDGTVDAEWLRNLDFYMIPYIE